MSMQSYMMSHIKEGAESLGMSPQEYLTAYLTGKLGDIQEKKFEAGLPGALATTEETKARTGLAQAQTGAVPSTVAETQARTALANAQAGAVPADIALKTAQAGAIPADVALKTAQAGAVPADVGLKTAQAAAIPADVGLKQAETKKALAEASAPTEALRNYNFATQQFQADPANAGKTPPSFDEWNAQQSGLKEAATQTNLLQTQRKMNAQTQLPDATNKIVDQLNQADSILGNPALTNVTGYGGTHIGNFLNTLPTTQGKALQAQIDQLTGSSGVSAVESLKGVGRILGTEYEAGTEAQSRLHDQTMSTNDYKQAVMDYRNKIANQLKVVYDQAGMPIPADLAAKLKGPLASASGIDKLLEKYK
jgi:hypothetical protein